MATAAPGFFLHPPVNVVRDSFLGFGLRDFTLFIYSFIYLTFEQIIVFQAGVRRNTLAWNNRTGPCAHYLSSSLFVGFEGHGMVNRDSNFQGRH